MVKNIFKVIAGIMLTGVIFLGMLVLFTFLPIPGNMQLLTVLSGSMEPAIKTGALVFVKPAESYAVGDVVTYHADGDTTFTHRIIAQSEEDGVLTFVTQGDANNVADDILVRPEMIVGKVLWDIPYMGYMTSFAKTRTGILLFVVLPATFIIIEESLTLKKELKKRELQKTYQDDMKKIL